MQDCSPTSLLHFGLFQPSLTDFLHTDTKAKVVKCKASEVFHTGNSFWLVSSMLDIEFDSVRLPSVVMDSVHAQLISM